MSENEIGLREARAQLGDIANRAHLAGQITYLMRNGRRIAAIVPINRIAEEQTMTATYTAAIGTTSDVVFGDYCDVMVTKDLPDGTFGTEEVMESTETDVLVDDPEALHLVEDAADRVLEANGWKRTGGWEIADNALYASVERDGQ